MKRCTLWISLSVLLLASPAVAADFCTGEPAVSETASVAEPVSLRGEEPVEGPESPPELGMPEPVAQTCTAELDCEDGNVISCTGNSSCTVDHFNGTVTCDGDSTQCPNWCKATKQLDCGSCPDYFCSCTSLKGDCQVESGGVTCDGQFNPCSCPFGC